MEPGSTSTPHSLTPPVRLLGPQLGDNVLITQISGKQFLARIYPDMKVSIGRKQLSCPELLENPYGTTFEIRDKKLVKLCGKDISRELGREKRNPDGEQDDTRTDLETISKTCLQKTGDTEEVCGDDVYKPEDVVKGLRDANETYDSKSSYGKEKWERRQRASHYNVFRVLPVTPYNLCKYYVQSKSGVQNNELSPEVISNCITQGLPDPRVKKLLIYDDSNGLFTSCIMWRMKGDPMKSEVTVIGSLSGDVSDRCKELNLIPKKKDYPGSSEGVVIPKINYIPMYKLVNPDKLDEYTSPLKYPAEATGKNLNNNISIPKYEPKKPPTLHQHERLPDVWDSITLEKVNARQYGRECTGEPWLADSLLICSRSRILPILRTLLPYVKSGAHMAACSRDPTALCECGRELLKKAACCNFRMSECFDSEMQVMEGMTHPVMSMEIPMSYVISCIMTTRPEKP